MNIISGIEHWISKNKEILKINESDRPIETNFEIVEDMLRIEVLMKRVINILVNKCCLHVNATYKLARQNNLIIKAGVADCYRQFRMVLCCILKSERTEDYLFVFKIIKYVSQ